MKKMSIVFAILVTFLLVSTVSAYGDITFPYSGNLVVKYVSQSADYDSIFGISSPVNQQLGTRTSIPVGTVFTDVGRCSPDTNVVLYMTTPQQHTYYSNVPGGDGLDHARITYDSVSGIYTVGFENVYGIDMDRDYNDIVLSVSCTADPTPVPEFPTLALPVALIIGMIGAVLFIRETREN